MIGLILCFDFIFDATKKVPTIKMSILLAPKEYRNRVFFWKKEVREVGTPSERIGLNPKIQKRIDLEKEKREEFKKAEQATSGEPIKKNKHYEKEINPNKELAFKRQEKSELSYKEEAYKQKQEYSIAPGASYADVYNHPYLREKNSKTCGYVASHRNANSASAYATIASGYGV